MDTQTAVNQALSNASLAFDAAGMDDIRFFSPEIRQAAAEGNNTEVTRLAGHLADALDEILESIFWTNPRFKQEARDSVKALRSL